MKNQDKTIRKLATQRVASIFNTPIDTFNESSVFGRDLKATRPPGLFRKNEYDVIEGDILDVCTREKYKSIIAGKLTIYTVGDYCNHMIEYYKANPKDVVKTLKADSLDPDLG
ncbi:hypothetical protein B0E42_10190 [Pseudomonas sp. A25(2017)]|uniref:hypothetical protein n=1 Tax=Pseudomonas sp. A25(2017) TaxID=1945865 RepID=UPI000987ADE9|nr:hypothetical protein [Pseudomonas sp. A25(2017)]OOG86907.1 hypothetical protein B0E42_10190 [Pseudomonas sp. A25(2017)]